MVDNGGVQHCLKPGGPEGVISSTRRAKMRTVLITLAAAASALAVATPAAAQYFPQPRGYAYGYDNRGQAQRLAVRIDNIQRQIHRLDRRNVLSNREARRLRNESLQIERRLR